ncbi:MAG: hypothetical protein ABUS79_31370, partial [Pseudomonadota bacterium]
GSVAGGGRYDDLVARFTGQTVPATGVSIGVSRLITALAARGLLDVRPHPAPGRWLVGLARLPPAPVLAIGGVVLALACTVSIRYLRSDPLEYDWQRLRSDGGMARDARRWMSRIDEAFGRQFVGGFMVGADSAADEAAVEKALRGRAEDEPGVAPTQALFRKVGSIGDFVPAHQAEKLQVLQELRRLIDRTEPLLDGPEAADLQRFRPPGDLRAVTVDDIPEPLARRYIERTGARGFLLFANQASRFDGWNGRDMPAFVDEVRRLDLPAGTAFAGGAFVFADVLQAVRRAGPRATLVASVGVVVFTLAILGAGGAAAITFLCLLTGTALMIAGAALLGLKVNFLDFVALPITLGIGVDYAVNVVVRALAVRGPDGVARVLATTGGAVVLCSWTTTVGYASLLLSSNAGIRSFGITAILGEATCLLAALVLAPALLRARERQSDGAG